MEESVRVTLWVQKSISEVGPADEGSSVSPCLIKFFNEFFYNFFLNKLGKIFTQGVSKHPESNSSDN